MFITNITVMPAMTELYLLILAISVGLMLILRKKLAERRIVPFVQGIEWVVIIIAVILLLFGAKKIPEFARSLGRATSEFKRGKMEVEREIKESFKEDEKEESKIVKTAKDLGINTEGKSEEQLKEEIRKKISPEEKSEENKVVKVAKDLGIDTEGKSEEQLKKEIAEKLK